MTIVDYNAGTVKDMGLAQAKVVTMDDKTTMEEVRIYLSIDSQNQNKSLTPVPRSYYP
jgi:hypothetical protein